MEDIVNNYPCSTPNGWTFIVRLADPGSTRWESVATEREYETERVEYDCPTRRVAIL